jgi:amino acid adenylation domain-containing protein
VENRDSALSLYHLLDPEVLANPYPLFRRLRSEDPVHWDPFLHAWVVTRYPDVMEVLLTFQADRTPTPDQLTTMGLQHLNPIAQLMVKQMLFMDAPAHTRLRSLASKAFTPARVEVLRGHIRDVVKRLLDEVQGKGEIDIIAELGEPLPSIITAEMLGVPVADRQQLKYWSQTFAEMLGNFQHNPERYSRVLKTVNDMTAYFHGKVQEMKTHPREGLIHSLMTAEVDGDRLTDEEVVANSIVTMVGGLETTTNLIGNGVLTLLRNPEEMARLRSDLTLIPTAIEEMLRYEPPSQHTARICPSDRELGGRLVRKRQAVIAVMAAANRDPQRFPDPDRFDIARKDNHHMAFGYAAHFCFGAALARIEGQASFEAMMQRLPKMTLAPQAFEWRTNLGLRGLKSLKVKFGESANGNGGAPEQNSASAAPNQSSSGCPYEVKSAASCQAASAPTRQELIQKYLKERAAKQKASSQPAIPLRDTPGPVPLSFAQEQIWLHCQFAKELYNESVTVYRRGKLDALLLEAALNEVIRRHESWRTTFKVIDGQPMQVVQPPFGLRVKQIDLRPLPESQREAEAQRRAREQARMPYHMEHGPLLRAMLVRLGDEEYRLYLSLHHLIFDGFSIYRVFLPELVTIYKAFVAGRPSPLPELTLQYPDFAKWQRETMRDEHLDEHRAYWSEHLSGQLPVLELPTDHARPAQQSFRGAVHRFAFPKALSEQLHELSRKENTTIFTTVLAGFAALLRRYTAQRDLVIGTVSSGRKRSELEALVGCFQNPLALRLKLNDDASFTKLLVQARDATLGALTHDEPFEHLVHELAGRRDTSRSPVFQVMFTLVPPTVPFESGWDLNQLDVETGTAKFDLDLEVDDRPEGLRGRFVYANDLFDAATIERLTGHFQTLLEAVAADPEQSVERLPMLTGPEKAQLDSWNDTASDYPRRCCMHELVEAQAERTPGAIAVEYGTESLTYAELDARSNQLAHFLRRKGVAAESKVGICLQRSLDLPVALLAVLKAGGACVPLDAAYPKDRLEYMLEDSQVPLVLTQPGLLAEVTDFNRAEVVNLEPDWKAFANESRERVQCGVKPENLAYVIYTSGSTGKPRGVLLTHAGFVNHNTAAVKLFDLTPADRMVQFASISFDIAIEEIFPTWISGGTLVVRDEDASLAPAEFLQWAQESRITVFDLPTAYWHELVRELSESRTRLPESLRLVIVGGEKASLPALAAWRKVAGPRVRWVNTYGPTETSVIVTSYEPPADKDLPAVLPIGKPIANTQVRLLDDLMQPVPVGIPADLYIGGAGLARGYLNRPEVTSDRFVPDPFSANREARLYRTGDRARYLRDGNLEFAGRTDDQVKVRGYRVELGEIEATLGSHAGVSEVVVIARENEVGEKTLIGYVVPARERPATGPDIRNHLKQRLPHYMVPSAIVFLEAMPKTPNGKVDKRALPAPQAGDFAQEQKYVAPGTETEARLTQLWEHVLERNPIGIRHNFFELGGHSLMAARLMHRIEQAFGQRLPLSALLHAPTIEQLAAVLDGDGEDASWSSLVEIQKGNGRVPFFCVHGVGGNVVGFRDLSRHLGGDQPFYALQPQGLDGKRPCLTTVEEMAERYLKEIRRAQPQGPYRLGGYSFGGLVAYEMAQRLQAEGEDIELLALFDAYGPGKSQTRTQQLKNLSKLPLKERISFVFKKGTFVLMTLRKRNELRNLPAQLRAVREACSQAADRYKIQPYQGRITLFRVREKSVGSLDDPYAIWWKLAAGGVDLHEISGDHLSMLKEPQVRWLAGELRDCLDRSVIENEMAEAAS